MRSPTLVDVLLTEIDKDPGALEALAVRLAPLITARQSQQPQADGWLDTKAAAEYLGITYNALRKHTAARGVPFEQDTAGGKCWFKRSELDAWRRGGHPNAGSIYGSNRPHSTAQNDHTRARLRPVNTG